MTILDEFEITLFDTPCPEVQEFLFHWESYNFTLHKSSLRCAPPLYGCEKIFVVP